MTGLFDPKVNVQGNLSQTEGFVEEVPNVDLLQFVEPVVGAVGAVKELADTHQFSKVEQDLQGELEVLRNAYEAGEINRHEWTIRSRDINKTYSADYPEFKSGIQKSVRTFNAAAAAPLVKEATAAEKGRQKAIEELNKEATIRGISVAQYQDEQRRAEIRKRQRDNIAARAQSAKIAADDFTFFAQSTYAELLGQHQERTLAVMRQNGASVLSPEQQRQLSLQFQQEIAGVSKNLADSYKNNAAKFGAGSIDSSALTQINTLQNTFIKQGQDFLADGDGREFLKQQVEVRQAQMEINAMNNYGKIMVQRKALGDRGIETLAEVMRATAAGDNAQVQQLKSNPLYQPLFQSMDAVASASAVADGHAQLAGVRPDTSTDARQSQAATKMATGATNVPGVALAMTDPRTDNAVLKGLQGQNAAEVKQHFKNTVSQVPDVYDSLRRRTFLANKSNTPELINTVDESTVTYVNKLRIDTLSEGNLNGNIRGDFDLQLEQEFQEVFTSVRDGGTGKSSKKPTGRLVITGSSATPLVTQRVNRMYNVVVQYPELLERLGVTNPLDAVRFYLDLPLEPKSED